MAPRGRRTTRRGQMPPADFLEGRLPLSRVFRSAYFPWSDPPPVFADPTRVQRHCPVPSFRIRRARLLQCQAAATPRGHFRARSESAFSSGAPIFLLFAYDHLGGLSEPHSFPPRSTALSCRFGQPLSLSKLSQGSRAGQNIRRAGKPAAKMIRKLFKTARC